VVPAMHTGCIWIKGVTKMVLNLHIDFKYEYVAKECGFCLNKREKNIYLIYIDIFIYEVKAKKDLFYIFTLNY